MTSHDDLVTRAAATYNAASDWFDAPENTFWGRFGARTIERLRLQPGMRVLDVCSGTGASAIPAAEIVGRNGHVLAIDVAQDLLARLRAKADSRGLRQLETRHGDLMRLDLPDSAFDAVVCVFGIFFMADMPQAIRHLWRRVAPGGQLAITTWGPRLFEPAKTQFWDAVRLERADLYKQFNPWDALTDPAALQQLLAAADVHGAQIVAEAGVHVLASPSAWWALVMGSGYRGTLEQLTASARERIQEHNVRYCAREQVSEVEANVLYAVAHK